MAVIKPFKSIRPRKGLEDKIAALPYDVYNRSEAKQAVKGNPLSFLNIDRPETQYDDDFDMYSDESYQTAARLLDCMLERNEYIRDDKAYYYIYELTMNGRAQTGPIFLAYKSNEAINSIVDKVKTTEPLYDFVSDDLISHRVWIISDSDDISCIQDAFSTINSIYIADGHHRCASAVKVSLKRRQEKPDYTGDEEFNYFLSVLFPDNQLMIMDYNRVIKDLNGKTEAEIIDELKKVGTLDELNSDDKHPREKGDVSVYIGSKWYTLSFNDELMVDDPVEGLDVSILQNNVLNPVFGIIDPKTDKRIDFVGGTRGTKELERRVNSDCKIAFAMYPTSIQELFDVADAGLLMPPKSTWFEPKLRSGLFIHEIEK